MNIKNTPSLEDSINRQLKVNRSKNLLFVNADQIMDIDPSFLAALEKILDTSKIEAQNEISSAIISYAAQALIKRIHAVNQFIRINERQTKDLENIYRNTWLSMRQTRDVRLTLRKVHYPALSKWLAFLYPKDFRQQLRYQAEVGHVVNEEYSAEFQIEMFGLDISKMKQPLLDIGCGSQANLVRYFRSLNIEAYGLDRSLEIDEPFLEQIDWFDYPFQEARWGTIISNMAFTNHLNFAYLHDNSQLEPYLRLMKKILASLILGGSYFYAPALPFIEDRLDADYYKVERQQVAGEVFFSTIIKVA